jgi:hypothetical protein
MEAAYSETSVTTHKTTQGHCPENHCLYLHHTEHFKSRILNLWIYREISLDEFNVILAETAQAPSHYEF